MHVKQAPIYSALVQLEWRWWDFIKICCCHGMAQRVSTCEPSIPYSPPSIPSLRICGVVFLLGRKGWQGIRRSEPWHTWLHSLWRDHVEPSLDGSLPTVDTLLSARAVWWFDWHCTLVLVQLEDNAPLRVDQIRVRRAVRSGLALGSESDLSGAFLSRTILTKYWIVIGHLMSSYVILGRLSIVSGGPLVYAFHHCCKFFIPRLGGKLWWKGRQGRHSAPLRRFWFWTSTCVKHPLQAHLISGTPGLWSCGHFHGEAIEAGSFACTLVHLSIILHVWSAQCWLFLPFCRCFA